MAGCHLWGFTDAGIDDLSFTCKKVGSNRLRIVATAKTAEVSQAQALELLQQLNTEMQMSTFKTQVGIGGLYLPNLCCSVQQS